MDPHRAEANRGQQAQLYGATMSDIVHAIGRALGLNQTRIAELIGLSGPMLSQLVGGGRVKIGNPVVSARLSQLRQLADAVQSGTLAPSEAPQILEQIRQVQSSETQATTQLTGTGSGVVDDRQVVQRLQDLFRSVAGAGDWLAAVDHLRESQPEIAELLRIYGTARTDEALTHFKAHHG